MHERTLDWTKKGRLGRTTRRSATEGKHMSLKARIASGDRMMGGGGLLPEETHQHVPVGSPSTQQGKRARQCRETVPSYHRLVQVLHLPPRGVQHPRQLELQPRVPLQAQMMGPRFWAMWDSQRRQSDLAKVLWVAWCLTKDYPCCSELHGLLDHRQQVRAKSSIPLLMWPAQVRPSRHKSGPWAQVLHVIQYCHLVQPLQ